MKRPKVHLRDVRFFVNAGMNFPVCQRDAELVDLEKCGWLMSATAEDITCINCIKRAKKLSATPEPGAGEPMEG